jgi:hypothetical protein
MVLENWKQEPDRIQIVQVVRKTVEQREFEDEEDCHLLKKNKITQKYRIPSEIEENGYVPLMTKTIKISVPENKKEEYKELYAKVTHIDYVPIENHLQSPNPQARGYKLTMLLFDRERYEKTLHYVNQKYLKNSGKNNLGNKEGLNSFQIYYT